MRRLRRPTGRTAIVVATLALILGGAYGISVLDRRAELFRTEADYHRRRQDKWTAEAAYLEALASDPSREAELPFALFKRRRWSRGQAIAMELELATPFCRTEAIDRSLPGLPHTRRWEELASEARRIAAQDANACRRMSEYHARQWRRYERVAFSPWLPLEPDQPPMQP